MNLKRAKACRRCPALDYCPALCDRYLSALGYAVRFGRDEPEPQEPCPKPLTHAAMRAAVEADR